MNYNKLLFLWLDDKDFYPQQIKKRGIKVANVFKRYPKILRAMRRFQIDLKIPFIKPWLESWSNDLEKYETIIIHSSVITVPVVKYIRQRNKNIRLIVWYWNPVSKSVSVEGYRNYGCEIWSFDKKDCDKYNLNFNTQYYFDDINLDNDNSEDKNIEVLFVGGDKDRIENLAEIKYYLDRNNLSNLFYITPTGNKRNKKYLDLYKNKRIPYKDIIKYISKSNAILDYVSESQSGMTIRPLEALFFGKKLITNDINIKNADFYNANNVFIIRNNNLNDLQAFLKKPYKTIDKNIIKYYDFDSWLKRFFRS